MIIAGLLLCCKPMVRAKVGAWTYDQAEARAQAIKLQQTGPFGSSSRYLVTLVGGRKKDRDTWRESEEE